MAVPPNTPPSSSDNNISFTAASLAAGSEGRMAVIVRESSGSSTAEKISQAIPTTVATTLGGVVEALSRHEMGTFSESADDQAAAAELLIAVNITRMPTTDTMLLAEGLRHSRAFGAVFVMTESQFSLFDRSLFHFVLG